MGKGVSAGFLIAGIGVGAGCMYLMDPNRGRPRRVLLRDKTEAAYRRVRTSVASAQSDFANREHGLIANVKSTVQRGSVDDERLVERVRAKLGRLVSHPHAIDVIARNGRITVSGAVLEHEAAQLLSGVGSIHGVSSVCDHIERHGDASNVPSLQGGRERHAARPEFLRDGWPPALRMLAGIGGGSLGVYGLLSSRPAVRVVALPIGLGLLARGITNKSNIRSLAQ